MIIENLILGLFITILAILVWTIIFVGIILISLRRRNKEEIAKDSSLS